MGENGGKTVHKTVPSTVRCTVEHRSPFLAFQRCTVVTVLPLKTVPFNAQIQRYSTVGEHYPLLCINCKGAHAVFDPTCPTKVAAEDAVMKKLKEKTEAGVHRTHRRAGSNVEMHG